MENNRFYLQFPCETYITFGFGLNESGRIGLKDVKNTDEPKPIPELAGVQVKTITSAMKRTFVFFNIQ